MKTKIYHGDLDPEEMAVTLANFFNRGGLAAQSSVRGKTAYVSIATRESRSSGGRTSLAVALAKRGERIQASVGEQSVLGLAGSLGASALLTWLNPMNLLGRLDDIAADIENLSLEQQVWKLLDRMAANGGASTQLARRLQRMACSYCNTANEVGAGRCVACGAPMGDVQPSGCPKCGFVVLAGEKQCPNCGQKFKRAV
ncbi:MAG TPA: zinc ribbon domain-containing protein [Anaerolineales bacterium]|nr:zinc ribbon domain-containing protein [Anaerolineales bacterium]HRQ92928.1 zinc ribbon domain-containing protein [Anaerolineales bacterium]